MRKIISLCLCVAATLTTHAQYQLKNGDFEQWEKVTYTSSKSCEEPVSWSSFYDATGGHKKIGTSSKTQIHKDKEKRPGSPGRFSCRLTSRSVFGVVAQGTVTNGCMNMGSLSASDASGNYNYINEARSDQAMRFSGHPDAVRFWVRFSGEDTGAFRVFLTSKGYFQDPEYKDRNKATLVAQALSANRIVSNDKWTKYTIPFEWKTSETDPYYAFVEVSTSAEAGKGDAKDYLYVDDIEMIYNSEATSVIYDGRDILRAGRVEEKFDPKKMGKITTNARAAKASWKYDEVGSQLIVTVEGENYSEDNINKHVYHIPFSQPKK